MSDMKVNWKRGFRKANLAKPEAVKKEIDKAKVNGEIDIDVLHDRAANKRNVLHRFCEWDDTLAAREHRKAQLRTMVSSIEVVYEEAEDVGSTKAYHAVASKFEPRKRTYQSTSEIMEDPVARASLLNQALNELVSMQRKYRCLAELAVIFRETERLLSEHQPK